jgi:large subunit ribosomal protein L35
LSILIKFVILKLIDIVLIGIIMKKKTHSGAKKRFKLTKNGKIKFSQASRRHHLTQKSAKVKRNLRHTAYLHKSDVNHIKSIL